MKNKNYVLLSFVFTFIYGIYTALGAVVSFITEPYGYTSGDNSLFAAILIAVGVVASIGLGIIIDQTAKYKIVLYFLCFGSILSVAMGKTYSSLITFISNLYSSFTEQNPLFSQPWFNWYHCSPNYSSLLCICSRTHLPLA
jgi:hypothetical protein